MYVFKQTDNGMFSASAPIDGVECVAATADEARETLRRELTIRRFRAWHDAEVRRATVVKYDPAQHCYVADCADMGIVATGFTRSDAMAKVYDALRQIAQSQRLAQEANGTPMEDNE